jgi:integrase
MKVLFHREVAGLQRQSYPISGNIANIQTLLLYLTRKGRSKSNIKSHRVTLTRLATKANLDKPEEVEMTIAELKYTDPKTKKETKKPATNTTKGAYCTTYKTYCKHFKIEWEKPKYTREPTGIQPPTNEKIQILIASTRSIQLSIKIDIIAQTGLRPIEITGNKGLKPTNLHPDQDTITATSTKGCNARPPMKITPELMTRLQTHILTKKVKPNESIFKTTPDGFSQHFIRYKTRLATRLNEPSIQSIRLYDLRHAYITRQLRKTQNVEIVRQIVGHKLLNTTQKYLHLLITNTGEWITEQTNDKERAKQLLNEDFTYIMTTPDGYMTFRKPK